MAGDLAAFGAPDEVIAEWGEQAQPQDDTFEVLAENWPAVRLFCALSTQWRRAGLAGAMVGLDYAAIEPTARLAGIEAGRDTFERIRVMEQAALDELVARGR